MSEYIDAFRDPVIAKKLKTDIARLSEEFGKTARIMEVCGTHTMAIARYGIRTLLPPSVDLISGPGCPVCVTDSGYIDAAIALAERGVIVATFGDMLKVPGTHASLSDCRAKGGDIRVCYSPLDTIRIAQENPDKETVFLAVGFETTIGPVVSIVVQAEAKQLKNVSILVAFKTVPHALEILASQEESRINAFLCPAHVSAIIGARAYEKVSAKFKLPCVVAGFEPLDILLGVHRIMKQLCEGRACVENMYQRVVNYEGNLKIQSLIDKYLEPSDVAWRGLGVLPQSGLVLRKQYQQFDAEHKLDIAVRPGKNREGCRCADVLRGIIKPHECRLFGNSCTPDHAIGPCMVSSEGSCAAYFKYDAASAQNAI